MSDSTSDVRFMEARLTLLERKVEALLSGVASGVSPALRRRIRCNEFGLIITRAYPVEKTDAGEAFCWVGNDGPLQFLVPVYVRQHSVCQMILRPYAAVDFSAVQVVVNDAIVSATTQPAADDKLSLEFEIPASQGPNLSISLLNVASYRPCDLGENADQRLLSLKFFGMEIRSD